jgi:hypothetical protein
LHPDCHWISFVHAVLLHRFHRDCHWFSFVSAALLHQFSSFLIFMVT